MKKDKQSLLWKILAANGKESYLFGSIHVHQEDLIQKAEACLPYLKQVEIFVPEINFATSTQYPISSYLVNEDHKSLRELIGQKKFEQQRELIEHFLKMDLNILELYCPLFILNQLTINMIGDANMPSMDEWLYNAAVNLQLKMDGLEDTEQHFQLLKDISFAEQFEMLKNFTQNIPKARRKTKKMLHAYQSQDLKYIFQAGRKMLGKWRKKMLFDRNKIMFQKIMDITKTNSAFFVCGAGHLGGDKGLIALLKKNKMKLIPIVN